MAIKTWGADPAADYVLHHLSRRLLTRQLLKLRYQPKPATLAEVANARAAHAAIPAEVRPYLVFAGQVTNEAYRTGQEEPIWIRYKDGRLVEVLQAADLHNLATLAQPVTKYYLVQPG